MELIIFGLITGAVYAIAASGLVVTYSTSGIFNFAHGALGMFCAYLYWDLRFNDQHKFWFIPHDSALQGKWPAPLALAAVLLVVAPALGAFIYRVIIRGLQGTSEIVKLVIPVSLMLGAISSAGWIWKTDKPHSLRPWWGQQSTVDIFGQSVQYHELAIVAIAIGLAIGLRILLYRTRTGVATDPARRPVSPCRPTAAAPTSPSATTTASQQSTWRTAASARGSRSARTPSRCCSMRRASGSMRSTC